ncbi:hypothetical protein Nmel_014022 [Mimus melanotis]
MANYALTPPKQDHFISAEKGPPASGHRRLQQTTKPPICVRVKRKVCLNGLAASYVVYADMFIVYTD